MPTYPIEPPLVCDSGDMLMAVGGQLARYDHDGRLIETREIPGAPGPAEWATLIRVDQPATFTYRGTT
jgi:hypothetical protein